MSDSFESGIKYPERGKFNSMAMGVSGSMPPAPKSEDILKAIDALRDAMKENVEYINMLTGRLTQVLTPEKAVETRNEKDPSGAAPAISPLADTIYTLVRQERIFAKRLGDLISRVEL